MDIGLFFAEEYKEKEATMAYLLEIVPAPIFITILLILTILVLMEAHRRSKVKEKRNWVFLYVMASINAFWVMIDKLMIDYFPIFKQKHDTILSCVTIVLYCTVLILLVITVIKQYKQGYIEPKEMKISLKRLKWILLGFGIFACICIIMIIAMPDT
jgi:hypothetical protein